MNIPATCNKWQRQMLKGTNGEPQILRNMVNDPCLPYGAEQEFFQRLGQHNPSTPTQALKSAQDAACGLSSGKADLYLSGRHVPNNRFRRSGRMINAKTAFYLDSAYSKTSGVSKADLEQADRSLVSAFVEGYDGNSGGQIGENGRVAWITEVGSATNFLLSNAHEDLAARLGLAHLKEAIDTNKAVVWLEYDREDLPESLHVPRALDAINHPAFRPETDCSAPCGTTHPLPSASGPGLPEAVHRSCKVPKIRLSCL